MLYLHTRAVVLLNETAWEPWLWVNTEKKGSTCSDKKLVVDPSRYRTKMSSGRDPISQTSNWIGSDIRTIGRITLSNKISFSQDCSSAQVITRSFYTPMARLGWCKSTSTRQYEEKTLQRERGDNWKWKELITPSLARNSQPEYSALWSIHYRYTAKAATGTARIIICHVGSISIGRELKVGRVCTIVSLETVISNR